MELPSAIVTLGTIQPEDGKADFKQKKRVSGRLAMPEGQFPRHAQNSLLSEGGKTVHNNPTCPITSPPPQNNLVWGYHVFTWGFALWSSPRGGGGGVLNFEKPDLKRVDLHFVKSE